MYGLIRARWGRSRPLLAGAALAGPFLRRAVDLAGLQRLLPGPTERLGLRGHRRSGGSRLGRHAPKADSAPGQDRLSRFKPRRADSHGLETHTPASMTSQPPARSSLSMLGTTYESESPRSLCLAPGKRDNSSVAAKPRFRSGGASPMWGSCRGEPNCRWCQSLSTDAEGR